MAHKSYEITGYDCDGDTYCPDCCHFLSSDEHSDGVRAIFFGSEWDRQLTCHKCGCKIEVSVLAVNNGAVEDDSVPIDQVSVQREGGERLT